jgi:transcriptional regulator of acetoin/glycerol metabolism
MINQFPTLLKEGIKQGAEQSGGNNQKMVTQISQIIDQSFFINESIEIIRKDLVDQLTETELVSVLEWLDSPLGKKVTAMEVAAMTSDAYYEMQSQLLGLQEKYRGSEREKLFQKFDKSTNATEASLETAMAVQLTLASAMSASSNSPQMPSYEYLKKSIEDNRFMMRGVIGQQVFANYLYTYQQLTDQELKAYVDFTASPAGQHYSLVVNESIKNVLLKPSEAIGSKIMGNVTSG